MAAAISAGSVTGTVSPAFAIRTTSAIPPTSVTIAGKPSDKACSNDIGKPSDFDDMMKTSAAEKNGATSSCCPQNVTCAEMSSSAAMLSNFLRSLPSPTIQSRKPDIKECAAQKALSSSE